MKRIIFPLDVSNKGEAIDFVKLLKDEVEIFKIGLELFCKYGPEILKDISKFNVKIFLDLKLHDIPNTVYGAVKNLMNFNPFFITVHLEEYKKFKKFVYDRTNFKGFLGVTWLTSLDEEALQFLTENRDLSVTDFVLKKAEIYYKAGCCGIVCSAHEAKKVREKFGDRLKIICPGIRLSDSSSDDQARVMTPKEAVKNGADFLVIGRPIREANNPLKVCREINLRLNDNGESGSDGVSVGNY